MPWAEALNVAQSAWSDGLAAVPIDDAEGGFAPDEEAVSVDGASEPEPDFLAPDYDITV